MPFSKQPVSWFVVFNANGKLSVLKTRRLTPAAEPVVITLILNGVKLVSSITVSSAAKAGNAMPKISKTAKNNEIPFFILYSVPYYVFFSKDSYLYFTIIFARISMHKILFFLYYSAILNFTDRFASQNTKAENIQFYQHCLFFNKNACSPHFYLCAQKNAQNCSPLTARNSIDILKSAQYN